MLRLNNKGQNLLEYVLLFGAIIGVIIVVLFGVGGNSGMKQQAQTLYENTGTAMDNTGTDLGSGGVFRP